MDENAIIEEFLVQEALPASYGALARNWLLPLSNRLGQRMTEEDGPFLLGISGAQGTGKSTASRLLGRIMQARGVSCLSVSLDDFYLSHDHRRQLAAQTHPLLATRGVPGTHDVNLLQRCFRSLQDNLPGELPVPRFDKASDDPLPESAWPRLALPVDLVILEGWFVGAGPQRSQLLAQPINALERDEDPDGSWRRYVNDSLKHYQKLFSALHYLVLLKAPNFDCVYQWRRLQEAKLIAGGNAGRGIMNRSQLDRFIQHFERLTRHCLSSLPGQADTVLELDTSQMICSASYRRVKGPFGPA